MTKINRRTIQYVLAAIWLIDGCLQLQPKMFTKAFINSVIAPAISHQPALIYDPAHLGVKIFLTHPLVFNLLIAIVQISIGLLILFKPTVKQGLWLSILWGLFVWYIGEAAAGMFSGHASLLVGLPGAALLYSLISLAVLPDKKDHSPSSWLVYTWSALWCLGAIFQLLPAQSSASSLRSMILANSVGAPGWLASLDTHTASLLTHVGATTMTNMATSGYGFIYFLAIMQLFIGIGVLLNKQARWVAILLGIGLSLVFWFVGQSLGGYYTGLMTDVQTAPLIIILGIIVLGQSDLDEKIKLRLHKLEKLLV